MSAPAYIVGIDLGTTNCAVAWVAPADGPDAAVRDFPVPQLQRAGEVAALPLLPSCLYAAGEHELPAGARQLPWGESPPLIAGAFARWQGARVPGRLVASAKSWLCHPGVDRAAAILPWGAPPEVVKISPVTAAAQLLAHLVAAWNHAHPTAPLAEQEVVITVPASFDEVARELTVAAARQAGLQNLTLVEEPQAAFYAFTARHGARLGEVLGGARLVLVVDAGGGTTDFTLIAAAAGTAGPDLRRLAVGDHLLLGGDNMDAALARHAEEQWLAGGRKLAAAQWTQLLQSARTAKETLLADDAPEQFGVAVAAEGSKLLRGTLTAQITRADAERIILEGFLPQCPPTAAPRKSARTALQELGLPYTQDPAITHHLAAFLRRHAAAGFAALASAPATPDALPRPDAVLLNGGVFNSALLARRLLTVISAWWPDAPPVPVLPPASLDYAVARGAAGYGLARRGLVRRISGGTAHGLYVGLGGGPGPDGAPRAVCLIPRGQEEGRPVELRDRPFELTLGRPVQFPLFSTTEDRVDPPGAIVPLGPEFRALPPIHALFPGGRASTIQVPVHLLATLTELGTLELWCVSRQDAAQRWRLEFELRAGGGATAAGPVTETLPARFAEARAAVDRVFGHQPTPDGTRDAKQLFRTLETLLGPRAEWRLPVLRELWAALFAGAGRRRRSPEHERAFYQLLGYTLRPGAGYPLDDWRCEQTFRLFGENVKFQSEAPVWSEFWILWRRIAGGLAEHAQQAIWTYLAPHLARRVPPNPPKDPAGKPRGPQPEGFDEMVRLAASLEHLEPADKVRFGNWIVPRLANPATAAGPWVWALGRLGARVPVHGSSHRTVDAATAEAWLDALLAAGLAGRDGAAFAVAQLARRTGDRTRDLADEPRARAVAALPAAGAPPAWLRLLTEVTALEAADESRALGDSLPLGLRLR